jgi:hypothetical protein
VRIDETEQEVTVFDWFAVDEEGSVAHFATAGFKRLPATIHVQQKTSPLSLIFFSELRPGR